MVRRQIGSLLGFVWMFVNPIVTIGVFWFVFSVGFKTLPVENVPFVVSLTAGMAIWKLFSDVANILLSKAPKDIFIPSIVLNELEVRHS